MNIGGIDLTKWLSNDILRLRAECDRVLSERVAPVNTAQQTKSAICPECDGLGFISYGTMATPPRCSACGGTGKQQA